MQITGLGDKMNFRRVNNFICLALAFCLIFITGCSTGGAAGKPAESPKATSETAAKASKKLVAVTIVPEETFVKAVCGDLADIVVMVPPGSSPETYEPTPQDMKRFSDASLYFTIGVPIEKASVLPKAGNIKVVSLQNEVASAYPDRKFEGGDRDAHIWLSPKRVKVMIKAIAKNMSELDRANEAVYNKNADAYIKQLDELDSDIKSALAGVKSKKFIIFHPAFGYLADDYGLTMYALEEEGKEATVKHLQDMIDFAKRENIKVVFYQEEIDSSQSKAFAEEIGGKMMQLSPLAADYINNLKAMTKLMAEVMQ